jgi:hypothetical protein
VLVSPIRSNEGPSYSVLRACTGSMDAVRKLAYQDECALCANSAR